MSRSQPSHRVPNPAQLWLGFNGSKGSFYFFDKDKKEVTTLPLPLTFLWLDELKKLGGFDTDNKCRFYSNEVRDTTVEPFTMRSFKGGIVAEGLYRDIKDKVEANGGEFLVSLYIALKRDDQRLLEEDQWVLANISFKGAALAAWIEFTKKHYKDIGGEKAIVISGSTEGKTGSVSYRIPKFDLIDAPTAALNAAMALDGELQEYLKSYFKRTTADRAEAERDVEPETINPDSIPF